MTYGQRRPLKRSRRRVRAVEPPRPPWWLWLRSVSAHGSLASLRRLAISRRAAPRFSAVCSPTGIGCSQTALTRSSNTEPRCGIPECRPGQSPARTPAAPSDPTLAPAETSAPQPDFQPTSPYAMSPKKEKKMKLRYVAPLAIAASAAAIGLPPDRRGGHDRAPEPGKCPTTAIPGQPRKRPPRTNSHSAETRDACDHHCSTTAR